MRVYLSARFERQDEMQRYSEQLRAEGIEVLSAWTELDCPSSDGFTGIASDRRALQAMMDVQQLVGSNVLVSFSDAAALCSSRMGHNREVCGHRLTEHAPAEGDPNRLFCEQCGCGEWKPGPAHFDPRGGKHVETGISLALGKRILLVGSAENVFHDLPDVEHFADWPGCLARILELRESDALTTRQAAEEAGVTVQDINRWIDSGELMAAKREGRYAVPRNDLDRVKARRRRTAAARASEGRTPC
jgi:hypothetical protein